MMLLGNLAEVAWGDPLKETPAAEQHTLIDYPAEAKRGKTVYWPLVLR